MTLLELKYGTYYHYRINIPVSYTKATIVEVQKWIDDTDIECSILPGLAFFKNKNDALLFILRWA